MKSCYDEDGITIYDGDCLEVMPLLPEHSIDAIIADLPYGTTACKWDSVIPLEPLWAQYKRLLKGFGAVVLTASQPFTSALVMSNSEWFKYSCVWIKTRPFDIFNSKNKPLRKHEDILVFSPGTVANCSPRRMTYNPQGLVTVNRTWKRPRAYGSEHAYDRPSDKLERVLQFTNYPTTVLEFSNPNNSSLHPTQKPLHLMEYLVLTYTNPNDLILDNTMGSGTTLLAARRTGRRAIGIETNMEYIEKAIDRLKAENLPLFDVQNMHKE
jgi:site-specific DNA-methyltransferase (adenine-specific)